MHIFKKLSTFSQRAYEKNIKKSSTQLDYPTEKQCLAYFTFWHSLAPKNCYIAKLATNNPNKVHYDVIISCYFSC